MDNNNSCLSYIQPKHKKHKEEFNRYIKYLKLKTKGEKFILNCLLRFDWNRDKIIQSIPFIKEENESIRFKVILTAPRISVNYSVPSPYKKEGWTETYDTLEKRMWYIFHQLDYYTK